MAPIMAGSTSSNQVSWSLGFMPDHANTARKIAAQKYLIMHTSSPLLAGTTDWLTMSCYQSVVPDFNALFLVSVELFLQAVLAIFQEVPCGCD